MKKAGILFTMLLSILIWASSVHALPMIDFTDSPFSAVNGKITETVNYGGLGITFTATNGLLTHNPGPSGGEDGIGIGDDEISLGELLEISFSTELYLSKIYITDLFNEGNPQYQEQGQFQYYTGSSPMGWTTFGAPPPPANLSYPASNGEYIIDLGPLTAISKIQFAGIDFSRNDYSVRGVDATPTPGPATMLLLGSGLIGVAAFGRKKFFKK